VPGMMQGFPIIDFLTNVYVSVIADKTTQ